MHTPLRTLQPTVLPAAGSSRRRGPDGRFLPRIDAAAEEPINEEVPPVTDPVLTPATEDDELPQDRFLNRELSWLDFNARVLALAEDPETPLLERAKFLAIFASNLDEFYMVRVAGLKRRLKAGLPMRGGDRSSLRHQLEMITERAADLVTRHAACFGDEVRPKLAAEGVELVSWGELDAPERERLRTYFREQVFPVLTP
jgi:polyphosphate kinase